MKREIKFRAWDEENKAMYSSDFPFIGSGSGALDIAICIDGRVITPNTYNLDYGTAAPVPQLTFLQYIGLQDKNAKPIYEGDILTGYKKGSNSDRGYTGVIEFRNEQAGWVLKSHKFIIDIISLAQSGWADEPYNIYQLDSFEVIGNIYENPELLTP